MGRLIFRDVEDLNDLPKRISLKKAKILSGWASRWNRRGYHKVNGKYPYEIVRRLVSINVGQNVDDVFSRYCKMVPIYMRQEFWDYFESETRYYERFLNNKMTNLTYYFVNEKNIISFLKTQPKKAPVRIYSSNAVFEKRHKVTGKKMPEYTWNIKNFNEDDYELVLVKGWCLKFDSKKDTAYKRIKAERIKESKREWKKAHKQRKVSQEEIKRILRERDLKEKADNLVKIISHGFDPNRSFRKEKLGVTEH